MTTKQERIECARNAYAACLTEGRFDREKAQRLQGKLLAHMAVVNEEAADGEATESAIDMVELFFAAYEHLEGKLGAEGSIPRLRQHLSRVAPSA
jgi:hypothetical protein